MGSPTTIQSSSTSALDNLPVTPEEQEVVFPIEAKLYGELGTGFNVPFASPDEQAPITFEGTLAFNPVVWANLGGAENPFRLKTGLSFAVPLWSLEQQIETEESAEEAAVVEEEAGIGDFQIQPPAFEMGLNKNDFEIMGVRIRPDADTVHADLTFGYDNFYRRDTNNSIKFVWSDVGEASSSRWGLETRLFDAVPMGTGDGRFNLDASASIPAPLPAGVNPVYQQYEGFDAFMKADKVGSLTLSFTKAGGAFPQSWPLIGGEVFFIPRASYGFNTDPVTGLYSNSVAGSMKIVSAEDDVVASLGIVNSGIEFGLGHKWSHSIAEHPYSMAEPWMSNDLLSQGTSWYAKVYFGGDAIPTRNDTLQSSLSGFVQLSGGTTNTATAAMLDNGAGGFDNIDLSEESVPSPLTLGAGVTWSFNSQLLRDRKKPE